jgi:hypothetical protein
MQILNNDFFLNQLNKGLRKLNCELHEAISLLRKIQLRKTQLRKIQLREMPEPSPQGFHKTKRKSTYFEKFVYLKTQNLRFRF